MARVVITGAGVLSPLGQDIETTWDGLREGRSGVGWMTLADTKEYAAKICGEVGGWDPDAHFSKGEQAEISRFSQFALVAAAQAIEHAGLNLEQHDPERIGVFLGNTVGGYRVVQESARALINGAEPPSFMFRSAPNMAAAWISIRHGLKGPLATMQSACASSTQALGEAAEIIKRGDADIMLAGGTEAGISDLGMAAFSIIRVLSTRVEDPTKACRPFDAQRDGFAPAEGAGVYVLERLEHAQARGAPILCELSGYASTSDAYALVLPPADGAGAARTIRLALKSAGRNETEVDYINAHGTATKAGDPAETAAIKSVFGERAYKIPISSSKSMVGHAFGAAGALELVACIKSIQTGVVHPTINLENPDPVCDLDYVPGKARQVGVEVVLKNSFGFGGQNTCLVLERF